MIFIIGKTINNNRNDICVGDNHKAILINKIVPIIKLFKWTCFSGSLVLTSASSHLFSASRSWEGANQHEGEGKKTQGTNKSKDK